MRTIKFRAWDTYENEMYSWGEIDEWDTDGIVHFMDMVDDERYHMMQFTGRYDKHGNTVYEGDIVRYCEFGVIDSQHYKNEGSPYAAVYWSDSSTCYCVEDGPGTYLSVFSEIEVIGNLYEHPHLLTEVSR